MVYVLNALPILIAASGIVYAAVVITKAWLDSRRDAQRMKEAEQAFMKECMDRLQKRTQNRTLH